MPIGTKSMLLGMVVAAAVLTPEGRQVATKAGTVGMKLGNMALKNKLGIDTDDIMSVLNSEVKKPVESNEGDVESD